MGDSGKVEVSLADAVAYVKSLPPPPPEVQKILDQNRELREARRRVPGAESVADVYIPAPRWPLVIVESPYAGDVERNTAYARAAMADCLARGEAPYASHALYTQPGVLRDDIREERERGIAAGCAWRAVAEKTVVYADLGISPGMQQGMNDALKRGCPVELRRLEGWE